MAPTPPSSPPSKRARVEVEVPQESSASVAPASSTNGVSPAGVLSEEDALSRHPFPTTDASFEKRIKSRVKAREATLAKTGEEPIWFDIVSLLGQDKVDAVKQNNGAWVDRFPRDAIFTGRVEKLSAHGVGLIIAPTRDWILAVPTVLPGELVTVRVDHSEMLYSKCDLVEVIEKSQERRDDLVGCKYFGDCGGCQYQMLSYDRQLQIKQDVVTKAFEHYSKLPSHLIPATLPTLASPEQYGYRTKLTPHFNLPKSMLDHRGLTGFGGKRRGAKNKWQKGKKGSSAPADKSMDQDELERLHQEWADSTPIGFDYLKKGGKTVMDIEECPIATSVINKALPHERHRVKSTIASNPAGATLLIRDSMTEEAFGETPTDSLPPHANNPLTRDGGPVPAREGNSEVVTSYRATVREKVEDVRFETPSGSFFQNNRSVLPGLVQYVRQAIVEARARARSEDAAAQGPHYLVDTYCGSGLFALLLAPLFDKVAGVEISTESIAYAKRNAIINKLDDKVEFLAGNAEDIFSKIEYDSDKTTVVIDPPRRGCDELFLNQLLKLAPSLVVYVSCNVHTQARDVGYFLEHSKKAEGGGEYTYEIVSVRGADLFPQTHHVEGVCVLRKR